MSIHPDELCKMPAIQFYHMVRFHAWEAHGQNEYSRLMAAKAAVKH